MSKLKFAALSSLILFLFFQSVSGAEENPGASAPSGEPTTSSPSVEAQALNLWNSKKIVIEVGPSYGGFTYNETKMNESISFEGVDARVSKQFDDMPLILKGDLEYLRGLTNGNYSGQTQAGVPLTTSTSNDTVTTMKAMAGARLFAGDRNRFDFTGGPGLRRLTNHIDGSGGYLREITYAYLPLCAEWSIRPTTAWAFGAGLEYDIFAVGSVVSHLSQASAGLNDVTNTQTSGYGDRVHITSSLFTEKLAYTLEIYQQYWNIQDSDIQYAGSGLYGKEPANNSTMTGANFRVSF